MGAPPHGHDFNRSIANLSTGDTVEVRVDHAITDDQTVLGDSSTGDSPLTIDRFELRRPAGGAVSAHSAEPDLFEVRIHNLNARPLAVHPRLCYGVNRLLAEGDVLASPWRTRFVTLAECDCALCAVEEVLGLGINRSPVTHREHEPLWHSLWQSSATGGPNVEVARKEVRRVIGGLDTAETLEIPPITTLEERITFLAETREVQVRAAG